MSSSRAQLVHVARRLGLLRERAVFVGGATLELLMSDPTATPIRPTDDVDLVVSARSRLEYLQDLSDELRRAGFKNDDFAAVQAPASANAKQRAVKKRPDNCDRFR